jgi:hypothetical protein
MDSNPYSASSLPPPVAGYRPEGDRPVSIKIFGILNIVFGVIGVLAFIISVISAVAMMALIQNSGQNNEIMRLNPVFHENLGIRFYFWAMMILGAAMTVVLIISGIGLLRDKMYGRKLALVYGWYAIVSGILGIVVNFFLITLPTMQRISGPGVSFSRRIVISSGIGGLSGLIFPALLLFFMYQANVRQYLERVQSSATNS